jgi:hypothetical protein
MKTLFSLVTPFRGSRYIHVIVHSMLPKGTNSPSSAFAVWMTKMIPLVSDEGRAVWPERHKSPLSLSALELKIHAGEGRLRGNSLFPVIKKGRLDG